MKQLFLYDFDGTITKKDTLFDFIKFSASNRDYYSGLLIFSPLFILAKAGFLKKGKVKQRFISFFLKGKSKVELSTISVTYLKQVLNNRILKKTALNSIFENKQKGDVYIVSASLDIWLKAISEHLGVGLICTMANYKNDIFDGKFSTPNCNYKEKVKRVINEININDYDNIVYFGDTKGDIALKGIVNEYYHKIFY